MSDTQKPWYHENPPSLRMWIFTQMTLGAVYAAAVFFGVIAFILIIRAVSHLLPKDPFAAMEFVAPALTMLG
ncbi:RC-LH1 core complex protein PufX [Palleronia caenipelagi]|uniref:Intrinsic membrane protein PufX n=1 Tax=Palleronia caenipelagi TaxID=2489174 RepID=A0A547Q7M6_9RHOB|nr:RC-LH1 core complex protein PufX [Palleronia caenipelagi]TRD22388.1 hypothetical protein FEV53_04840 [Palleronia caenipelagi]